MTIVVANGVDIAASGLAIYVECGDEDALALHHGAEALHRRLWEIGLRHEYRSVRGANHVGRSIGPRMVDALGFLGRALKDGTPDPMLDGFVDNVLAGHVASGLKRETVIDGPAGPTSHAPASRLGNRWIR